MLNSSTNNSHRSNRFSAPEHPLPKLSNGHYLGWELAPLRHAFPMTLELFAEALYMRFH